MSARSVSRRESAAVVLAGIVLSLVVNRPVVGHLSSHFSQGRVDPMLQSWQLAWGGHALSGDPTDIFQSNAFWPLPDSLAFSDPMIGYAPIAMVGEGRTAAVTRFNVLILIAFALAFVGAYLLARALGARPVAAAVAGVAFAYAPWRLAQLNHLHVLSSGGIPLTLFLLVRGYRERRAGLVVAGWLVATWQMSLGFTLGLQLGYLLALLGVMAAVRWLVRGRPAVGPRIVAASAVGIIAFVAWTAVQARPFLRVADRYPEARRTTDIATFFSPPPRAFLSAPEGNTIWSGATAGARRSLEWPSEQTLFPGAAVLGLAAAGLGARASPRGLRAGLGIGAVVAGTLALGFRGPAYGLLYDVAPGWQGIRAPGRLYTLASLALALLAALGAERIASRARDPGRGGRWALLLAGVVLVEGLGTIVQVRAPEPPPGLGDLPTPVLHLPADEPHDAIYVFWSTDGFPPTANGYAAFIPEPKESLNASVAGFPSEESVARLRALGIRTVVLHRDLVGATPWEGADARPSGDLGIGRAERGSMVVFDLRPSST